jgi:hypothetical protein
LRTGHLPIVFISVGLSLALTISLRTSMLLQR